VILYKNSDLEKAKKKNNKKTINITIDEKPERPIVRLKSSKDRVKFIKTIEQMVRSSMEYKDYIKFLKNNMDMNRCLVLKNIANSNNKRYSIEIHHEPFTLFQIVDAVITKCEDEGQPLNPFYIADEVMRLHYDEKVGLIPLTKTCHELVHSDKIFIPLQLVYHKYNDFFEEYYDMISDNAKEALEIKVNMSLKCGQIQSDSLDTEFVYMNIDGFDYPNVPDSWGKLIEENKANSPEYSN